MFTGIVEEVGTVRAAQPMDGGCRITVGAVRVLDGLMPGDSIAVNGVCQTVVALTGEAFVVEAIGTTLSRTTLGEFETGRRVNLERPLALGDRLGGHLVQGHVDAVGLVSAIERRGEHVLLDVAVPDVIADVAVLHGSIAIDGVSLTINALTADDTVQVALIPHTWNHTTLSTLEIGDGVNLEGDMIGRFVTHWLKRRGGDGV
ncbi:MAG TPA: riboflavin synthase [Longimicrobiales bacterium]|nr:riboflavin synthase [Longimicrobiales bacterium]